MLFDVVKILEEGDYTFADLLYSGSVLEASEGMYRVHLDNMGSICSLPNSAATDLLICIPRGAELRHGCEQVRRSYQGQVCVYQSQSDHYAAGEYVAFTTVLVPLAADQAAEPIVESIHYLAAEDGRPGTGVRLERDGGYVQVTASLDPEAAFLEENVRPRYSYESGYSRYGDLETDARFCCIERVEGKVSYSLVEATRLSFAGSELFAPPVIPMRQDDGTWKRPGVIRWRAWEGEATV